MTGSLRRTLAPAAGRLPAAPTGRTLSPWRFGRSLCRTVTRFCFSVPLLISGLIVMFYKVRGRLHPTD